jgi:hypothetical protein
VHVSPARAIALGPAGPATARSVADRLERTRHRGAGGSEPRPIQQYAMALRCGHTDNAACYDKRSAGCCCPGRLLPAPSSSPDIETRASASWTHLESCLLCGWRVAWRSPARPAQPASLLHLLCWFAGAVTIVCWRWPVLASGAGPSPVASAAFIDRRAAGRDAAAAVLVVRSDGSSGSAAPAQCHMADYSSGRWQRWQQRQRPLPQRL